ncbi:MAG: DUF1292 domain-containing protein [bacterium]
MSEQDNLIVLVDEEGNELEFEVIDVIEVDGLEYVIVQEVGQEDKEAEVLRIDTDESGEEVLVPIEDDEELERVAQTWEEMLAADYEEDEEL